MLYKYLVIQSSYQPRDVGSIIIPTLLMKTLRHSLVRQMAQVHTATSWGSQDSSRGFMLSTLLITEPLCLYIKKGVHFRNHFLFLGKADGEGKCTPDSDKYSIPKQ